MLCQVHLKGVSAEEKELLECAFFHPYDKLEERNGELVMNYMGGKLCRGVNDFGERCGDCRYMPYMVRKILRRQKDFAFGKEEN
ncbi:MAG: hypothetical protein ACLPYB_09945 [Desulfobaccales bacterium]